MLDPRTPVGHLVLDHAAAARVLRRHRIDFCCHGDISLADACAERGVAVDQLRHEIELTLAESRDPSPADPRELDTHELIDLIVLRHHGYLREVLPFVVSLAEIVASVHRKKDPRLVQLEAKLAELQPTLLQHLDHEERVLFPRLRSSRRRSSRVARELEGMKSEHREVGRALARLSALTDHFVVPDDACSTHRALLAELEAIEADVFQHVHLENYVLAPRFEVS